MRAGALGEGKLDKHAHIHSFSIAIPDQGICFDSMHDGYIKQALKSNTPPSEVAGQQFNEIVTRITTKLDAEAAARKKQSAT